MNLFKSLFPNIVTKPDEVYRATLETIQMFFLSGIISLLLGIFFGMILAATREKGLLEQKVLFTCTDKTLNFFRSIPFIILLTLLIPVTRFLSGSAIGVRGSIVPLVFGTVPFYARQVETALLEVNRDTVEAAKSMGLHPVDILFRVLLRESAPSLIRSTTVTAISLIGLTTMAGAIGAGGLGDFAIRYGYQRDQFDVTVLTIFLLLIFVTLIQSTGNHLAKRCTH